MAPVIVAPSKRRSVCRMFLRLSPKIYIMFPAATVSNLGENQFNYVSETHINPYIGRFKALFLHGDGLTSAHTDRRLRCIAKYVIEWGLSKRGDKTERSHSFLEMNEQKL